MPKKRAFDAARDDVVPTVEGICPYCGRVIKDVPDSSACVRVRCVGTLTGAHPWDGLEGCGEWVPAYLARALARMKAGESAVRALQCVVKGG